MRFAEWTFTFTRWGEEHFSELVESRRYLMLPADALVSFLSSDRLNAVCESQVWNFFALFLF